MIVAIADIARVVRGVSYDKNASSSDPFHFAVPILRAGNIQDQLDVSNDLIWVPATSVSHDQLMRAGDIAICMSSGSSLVVGKSAQLNTDWQGSVGAFCAIIRADASRVIPRFLAYALRADRFRVWTQSAQGINIKNIKKSDLENYRLDLPPIPEQQRIVDILDRAASIQRLRRAGDDKLKEMIPALFVDMFGDPATNPKGWPVNTIGDVITSADYGSSAKASDDPTGLPMLRMGNVTTDGRLDLDNLKYVHFDDADRMKYRLCEGDILFNRTNSKELVGKTGIWSGGAETVYASYFIRLQVDKQRILPEVLWAFMNSKAIKARLFGMARGAIGQSNINSKELKSIPIYLPPIDLQKRFSAVYHDIVSQRRVSKDAELNANQVNQTISQMMFHA